ncbi:hypothetical protein EB118_20310 [bacterium]|nr:hypothetical protein [bacterium]
MAENRLTRDVENRERSARPKQWKRADVLPEVEPMPGYKPRWVRVASLGKADPKNVSAKLREGWEPVRIEEQPNLKFLRDENSRFKDNIEIDGLLLCKIPEEFVDQRSAYFNKVNKDNMDAVDSNFMRESDARMPLFAEKRTKVSFGKGT